MRTSKLLLASGLMLGSLSFTAAVQAAVFNVTNGTELQNALTTAENNGEGDTINLAAGTYDASSGSFAYDADDNFPLTLTGPTGGGAVLDGGDNFRALDISTDSVGPADENADLTFQNLTFQNGAGTGDGGGLAVFTYNADTLVENCVFRDNTDSVAGGLAVNVGESGNTTIRKNSFFNNIAETYAGGAKLSSSTDGTIVFDSNLLVDNSAPDEAGGAILDADAGNILVTNNIVAGNTVLGGSDGGGGLEIVARTGGTTVVNNTFFGNESAAVGGGLTVWIDVAGSEAQIYNNIFFENSADDEGDDIFVFDNIGAQGSQVDLFNNIVFDFTTDCIESGLCIPNVDQGSNDDVDPLFTDAANDDFTLQSGSPALEAGDPNAPQLPTVDFNGNPRSIGSAPDLGALEGTPAISIDPATLNFGAVDVGDETTQGFTITNNGTTDLSLAIFALSDDINYEVDLEAGNAPCGALDGQPLGSGESCTGTVTFAPTVEGDLDGTLTIFSDDPSIPNLVVTLLGSSGGGDSGGCSLGAAAGMGGSWLGMGLLLLGLAFRRRISR